MAIEKVAVYNNSSIIQDEVFLFSFFCDRLMFPARPRDAHQGIRTFNIKRFHVI